MLYHIFGSPIALVIYLIIDLYMAYVVRREFKRYKSNSSEYSTVRGLFYCVVAVVLFLSVISDFNHLAKLILSILF